MNLLLIAGGAVAAAFVAPELPEPMNHTLDGAEIKAAEVVCRNRYGTPMLPERGGSYSIAAPYNAELVRRSLVQPPRKGTAEDLEEKADDGGASAEAE